MLIKAALNGSRSKKDHPAIPITPAEQATEAKRALSAGAGAIHVHVYDRNGQESLNPYDVSNTLKAIRSSCPGVSVGLSTGAWIVPDGDKRISLIQSWEILPDFVSINIHEEKAIQLAKLFQDKAVGVEAGVWTPSAAECLLDSGIVDYCLRILIEPQEKSVPEAVANIENIESIFNRGEKILPRLLHGLDATTWDLIKLAAQKGYDTRAGFEDTLTLPDGSIAENNAALVAAAGRIAAGILPHSAS